MPIDLEPRQRTATRHLGLLLAVVLIGFGLLHVIGGALMRHGPERPPDQSPISNQAD
jgi:hypothetical protein